MACFDAAKLPDATARSTERPTASEVRSSARTARQAAAFELCPAPAAPSREQGHEGDAA